MRIYAAQENIPRAIDFVEAELKTAGVQKEKIRKTSLSLEEILVNLICKSNPDSEIDVTISRFMGRIRIRMKSVGLPLQKAEIREQMSFDGELTEEESIIVSDLIDKVAGDAVHLKSSRGINRCTVDVTGFKIGKLTLIFGAMFLGIFVGFALKMLVPQQAVIVSDYVFTPIYTMFLNALKMIVAPLVFITITNSVMEFDDIKTLGRIAGKTTLLFMLTSLVAIAVGFLTFKMLPIGDPSLQSTVSDAADETISNADPASTSLLDMLVNIIPSDVVSPFLETDMLQVLFMAILLGISVSMVAKNSVFSKFLTDANAVMLKLTGFIIAFLPLSAFCSLAKLIITTDLSGFLNVFVWVPVNCVGHIIMLFIYAVLLIVFARMNPVKFLKAYYPAIVTAFATSSSNATMPMSMERCRDGLRISPKVYAFSIPFGATVNMHGNCITLVVTTLFMANIYEVSLTTGMIVSLVVTVLALTMGSPGIPGGNIVCMTIVFPMIGVPPEAVSLIIGLYCIMGMTQTIDNVTGDAVVSTMVARWEKLIGEEEPQKTSN